MTTTEVHTVAVDFEQQYLALRQKEGRIYTDEEVLSLPDLPRDHRHYKEWQIRKESCERLKHYLGKRLGLFNVLEVGCGNGWLSHQLALILGYDVTGTDINLTELAQAERVFSHIPYLQFVPGGMNAAGIEDGQYDFIVFAASIQYFPSLGDMIREAFRKLKENGEVHILDSPFYEPREIDAAQKRATDHFTGLGFPEMASHYFHHTLDELQPFHYRTLYKPSFVNHNILDKKNPFPWLVLKKM